MDKALRLSLAVLLSLSAEVAFAKGQGNLERPIVAQVKATDLFLRPVRKYECTLESTPTGSWFLDEKVTLEVEARSVQDALELALTPYVTEPPADAQARIVKTVINGRELKVRDVGCKVKSTGI